MLTKDERVANEVPENRHKTRNAEALGQHAEHVLRADETAVEESQTWKGHEQNRAAQIIRNPL